MELVRALRDGDEAAFAHLVDAFGGSMQRVAALYVRDRAVVQEVVQDTWVAVLRGIDRFESRSSLAHMALQHPRQHRKDARGARVAVRPLCVDR